MSFADFFLVKNGVRKRVGEIAAAFEYLPDAIFLRGRDGSILYLNRKAEEVFRIRRDEVIGRAPESLDKHEMLEIRRALSLAIPSGGETRFVLPFGERTRAFIVSHIVFALRNGDRASLWSFRETTREDELSRLKTQFMSIAAHQLRTPAAAIKWILQTTVSGDAGPLSNEQRDLLSRAGQAVDRMIQLIADLLDVTRIEEGRLDYTFKEEPAFADFVKRITESFYERASAKNVTLTFLVPAQRLPPLHIDPSRLSLALENILANAINYTFQGGVEVRLERKNDDVVVIVSDTGIGVPQNDQKKIFSKFVRGTNAIERGIEGTGLGLFIVRSIVKRHGGEVSFFSKEGSGTTVTLILPVDPSRIPTGEVPLEEVMV